MSETYTTIEQIRNGLNADTLLAISFGVGMAMAFTKSVRRRIIQRDGGCMWDGDDTTHAGGLEAAHINHAPGGHYNDVNNGRALCTRHHLDDHIDRAGENGLSDQGNDWAIAAISLRLSKFLSDNE